MAKNVLVGAAIAAGAAATALITGVVARRIVSDANKYDKEGYNKEGYDKKGFNKQGYKADGLDCSNNDKNYYRQKIAEIDELLQAAFKQMKQDEYSYALSDIRKGLEKSIKCIIEHSIGEFCLESTLHQNIEICSEKKLLDDEQITKLRSAKKHCNDAQHDNSIEKKYNQVHFAYKTLEEIKHKIEKFAA